MGCEPENCSCTQLVSTEKSRRRPKRVVASVASQSRIPADIAENAELNRAMECLPANYNFEVHKTLWRLRERGARRVALQMPEGLLMFACMLSDIIERFGNVECVIMGDVTYGACCVGDHTAAALGCDFTVHYGHSCLVPVTACRTDVLYVFVDIAFDVEHLIRSLEANFDTSKPLWLAGTIQFASSIQAAAAALREIFPRVEIPQEKPLSKGEVLGCTSPLLPADVQAAVFLADGRFHLESLMIRNPRVACFQYNPYTKRLTRESYDHARMHSDRKQAIDGARLAMQQGRTVGVVMSTLGRQGNMRIIERLQQRLNERGVPHFLVLLSEIFPHKLAAFNAGLKDTEDKSRIVGTWIQVGCPRLSIDWGIHFEAPLLNPYEAFVSLDSAKWLAVPREEDAGGVYPMDFYSGSGGQWTNYWQSPEERAQAEAARRERREKHAARRQKLRRRLREKRRQQQEQQSSDQAVQEPTDSQEPEEEVLHPRVRRVDIAYADVDDVVNDLTF